MILRDAKMEDCEIVARGICMALHRELDGEMQKCIARICEREDVLYSYRHTMIAWEGDSPMGICLCYDGANYHDLRQTTFPLFDELMPADTKVGEPADSMDIEHMQDEAEAGEYYMDSLAVWPEWRGHGVGRRLMEAQLERAKTLGFNKATLLVDPVNESAKRLYRSLGFEDYSEVYAFGQIFWKWVKVI